MEDLSAVENRAARVRLLLMDCDGVLTDGRLWLLENGDERKSFNVKDGLGLELFHRAGLQTGIISGRTSSALERRARDLGVAFVRQGAQDKILVFEELIAQAGVAESEVAFVGDDLADIVIMRRSEFGVAVADAAAETRSIAHYVTRANGGEGAVREVVEIILKAQGRWADLVREYVQ